MQLARTHRGVQLELAFLARWCLTRQARGCQGFLHAGLAAWRLSFTHLGQHLGEQLLGQFGVAKEGVEQLVEHLQILLAADQNRLQGGVQVFPAIQSDQGG